MRCRHQVKLKHKIRRAWPNRKMNQVLFLHESQTPHQRLYKGVNCNNRVDYSPSSSLQYQFSIFQLSSFWPVKNAFQWTKTQHVWRALMLQQRVLCNQHTASHTKVKKSVLIKNETLWKNNLNSVKDVPMIYISEKKKCGINFVLPLILKCYYTEELNFHWLPLKLTM